MGLAVTRHFPALFARQCLRPMARRPVLLGINVASIALGVAVFLAIQIANRSANQSFRAGIEMVAGRANLEVRGAIDERVFPEIGALEGVVAATPLVEGIVTIPGKPGEYLRVVGLDPFSGGGLRTFELLGAGGANLDFEAWLRDADAIAVSREFSDRILPALGSPLRVMAGGRTHELRPAFVIEPEDAAAAGDPRMVAMDIGWAQELLGRAGRLDAILLLVDPARLEAVTAAIRALVPAGVEVSAPARRGDQVESMLGAFQLNLTALSMVSVLVGTFLIYNTISASVIRRRTEIGMLRALGASRLEVRGLFLGEALLAGAAGTLAGMALALPLASALTEPVARTISSLYVLVSIDRLFLSPAQFFEAALIGLGASLAAAWRPASEAANCDPARVLHPGSAMDRFESARRVWLIAGAVCLAAAAVAGMAALRLRIAPLGFASAFFVLMGFSFVVPAAIGLTTWLLRGAPRLTRLAARNLSRSMHRNAITIAALAAAIAMTVGISVMIHSFRGTVDAWIESVLTADLYLGSAANEIASAQADLPREAVAWLRAQPGVQNVATFSELPLEFRGERTALGVVFGKPESEIRFLGGGGRAKYQRFLEPGAVIVSEPFANRFHVSDGERLRIPTPRGDAEFEVAGVFQDYARNAGTLLITRGNYERLWGESGVQSVALTLDPGVDAAGLGARFRERFGRDGALVVYSNRALRERIFEIFDQTFAVTLVLRGIAIIVAAAGVMLALLILAAEREREIGVMRAVGASAWQVMGLFLREAALIGMIASVIGVASGACLAVVLTFVVNKAYFGWTIDLSWPLGLLAATPLWIVPVAIAAALLPAWRAAQIPPAAALRFE